MKLFVVGKITNPDTMAWSFKGVFTTKEKAISKCRNERYFIGPCWLDFPVADPDIVWPGAYYPIDNEKSL